MQFNKNLQQVKVYEAGKPIEFVIREFGIRADEVIKLASNENPYGCSPLVIEAVQEQLANHLPLYPDDSYYTLKQALSTHFGVQSDNIVIGCGSDQIISFCIEAKSSLAQGTNCILTSGVTFPMYDIAARINGMQVIKTASKMHNLQQIKELYRQHRPDIVFLCIPNNPLGECLDREEVYDFIACCDEDTLIVVDGAYQEYASCKDSNKQVTPKALMERFSHVIYLGTFSKAYGLGGMRVGYGISHCDIIKVLHQLRPPFNITSLSLEAATVALTDQDFVQRCVRSNFEQMSRYETFLHSQDIHYIDSYTNFITCMLPQPYNSTQISEQLLQKGIIIRNFATINALRITIGRAEHNDKVLEALTEILN